MRKLLLMLIIIFSHQIAFADQCNKLKVRINFNYQHQHEKNTINDMVRLDSKNQQWEVISDLNRNNNSLILLAQIEHSDSKTAKLRFLLLQNNNIVSQPQMVVAYDQPAKMVLEGKDGKINLNVSVNR